MIRFFSEETSYLPAGRLRLRQWLNRVVSSEKARAGSIQFIFCNDEFLLKLNRTYLNHDTYTDIITFPSEDKVGVVSGDIYISIPRVRENAEKFGEEFEREVSRVMVHGVLHLLGYKDKTRAERKNMVSLEEKYLALI